MSPTSTKAIWGAIESFSNKITHSVFALRGSDRGGQQGCTVPTTLTLGSSNPGPTWPTASESAARRRWEPRQGGARPRKDHLLVKLNCTGAEGAGAMAGMKRRGEQGGIKATRTRRKTSQCSPSVMPADKETNYISASWHRRVKLSGGSHHSAPAGVASVLGTRTLPLRSCARADQGLSSWLPFVFCQRCRLLCLSSTVRQNWLLLFQIALSLLMPQVFGPCTSTRVRVRNQSP